MANTVKLISASSGKNVPRSWYTTVLFFLALLATAGMAYIILLGWINHNQYLIGFPSPSAGMNPMVAICFELSVVGICILGTNSTNRFQKTVLWLITIFIAIQGLGKVLHLANICDLKLDLLAFPSYFNRQGTQQLKGRMAYTSGIFFLLLSIVFVMKILGKAVFSVQMLLTVLLSYAVFSVLAVLYHIDNEVFGTFSEYKMAFSTAICSLFIIIALWITEYGRGVMIHVAKGTPGGHIFRSFIPIVLLFPFIFLFFQYMLGLATIFDSSLALSISATFIMSIMLLVIFYSAYTNNLIYSQLIAETQQRRKSAKEAADAKFFADTIIEHLPTMVFVKTFGDFKFIRMNKAGSDLLKMDRSEVLGRTDFELFPEEYAAMFRKKDMELVATGKTVLLEEQVISQEGKIHWLRTKKVGVNDEKGNPLFIVGIAEDITEIKTQQEKLDRYTDDLEREVAKRTVELRESEERYLEMVSQVKDYSIIMLDIEGKVVSWNKGAENTHGYIESEILGCSFDEFYTTEDRVGNLPQSLLEQASQHGSAFIDIVRVRKDKSCFWANVNITAIRDKNNQVKGFSEVSKDITARKTAEQELHRLQVQFSTFMEALPLMTFILNEKHEFLYANSVVVKAFNIPDIRNRSIHNVFPEPYRAVYINSSTKVFETNKTHESVEESVDKNGEKCILRVIKFPLNTVNGLRTLGGIGIDITKQVQHQQELIRLNEQLTISNRDLEQFAYITSHDLQEPLRTLLSITEIMSEEYKGQLAGNMDTYIDFIRRSSLRMQGLIKAVLDYSRLGKEISIQRVDTDSVIKDVIADMSLIISEVNAMILVVTDMPVVNGYDTELRLLFQNLISNGIKFSKKNVAPQLTIAAEEMNDREWLFSVTDNGIGIAEDKQGKIFEIFRRLHNREEYDGLGIGLSHCKKIVELHGGQIWVKSKPGSGCTFYFTIPK